MTVERSPMGLVGRGSHLLQTLADDLGRSFGGPPMGKTKRARLDRHRVGNRVKAADGGHFDVSLVDEDGKPTGYIARVTVSYVGFDAEEANRRG
jgi:hypothetical protein